MTFKLVSQVTIDSRNTKPPYNLVDHFVLSRERRLHPGDIIKAKGFVATDVETKGPSDIADVLIRIIDEERLGITWVKEKRSRLSKLIFPEVDSGGFFDPERIVQGKDPLELDDIYHKVWYYHFPESFNPLDRISIPFLEWSKTFAFLHYSKDIRRESKIQYEPTLPPQARK